MGMAFGSFSLLKERIMALVTTSEHKHVGHASKTPNPFHQTKYVASQSAVTCGGFPVITAGDATACGDPVVGVSSKVTVGGKGVHRLGDATGGHGATLSWVANASAGGHPQVDAG
jgi:uncharacterized Zn-binding protein involved in type VI secretion